MSESYNSGFGNKVLSKPEIWQLAPQALQYKCLDLLFYCF